MPVPFFAYNIFCVLFYVPNKKRKINSDRKLG